MIKENLLGDTNKIYLTLQEADSSLPENWKMGWKARSFYGMKNKEQGRDKWTISGRLGARVSIELA